MTTIQNKEFEKISKEFNESFVKSKKDEEEEKKLDATTRIDEVVKGIKYVTSAYGTLIFNQPSYGIQMEADRIFVRSKTNHLLKRDILTKKQLESIYGQPFVVKCDCGCDKDVVIGTGEWSIEKENEIKKLQDDCEEITERYNVLREEFQTLSDRVISENPAGATLQQMENRKLDINNRALDLFSSIIEKRSRVITLVYERYYLFSGSLEEVCDTDRSRYLAIHCVKKLDGSPLWENEKKMLEGTTEDGRIFGIFHFWIRGVDIDFFEQLPELQKLE